MEGTFLIFSCSRPTKVLLPVQLYRWSDCADWYFSGDLRTRKHCGFTFFVCLQELNSYWIFLFCAFFLNCKSMSAWKNTQTVQSFSGLTLADLRDVTERYALA